MNLNDLQVKIHVFPGGKIPERKTELAVGFDVFTRAIVSLEMEPGRFGMRKTFYDFEHEPDPSLPVFRVLCEPKLQHFRIAPRQELLFGCGFALELPSELSVYVYPRSSTVAQGLWVTWSSVPGDPDFRGEFVFGLYNSSSDFVWIKKHDRLVQLVFTPRIIPELVPVSCPTGLSKTKRRGNGHTGK